MCRVGFCEIRKINMRRVNPIKACVITACVGIIGILIVFMNPDFAAGVRTRFGKGDSPSKASTERSKQEQTIAKIKELKDAIVLQEAKVKEALSFIASLVRSEKLFMYPADKDSADRHNSFKDVENKDLIIRFQQLEGKMLQLDTLLQNLVKYEGEQLAIYAAGIDLEDNIVKILYPNYLEQERLIEELKASGIAEDHPTIISHKKTLNGLKSQLDEGVANLQLRLQGQLDMTKELLAKVEERKNQAEQDSLDIEIKVSVYFDAKQVFQTESALLERMKLQFIEAEAAVKHPVPSNENSGSPKLSDERGDVPNE